MWAFPYIRFVLRLATLLLSLAAPSPALAQGGIDSPKGCDSGESIKDLAGALQRVSDGFDQNYSRIRTWRGMFRVTETTLITGERLAAAVDRASNSTAPDSPPVRSARQSRSFLGEFAVDFAGDRLFTAKRLAGPSTLEDGKAELVDTVDRLSLRGQDMGLDLVASDG